MFKHYKTDERKNEFCRFLFDYLGDVAHFPEGYKDKVLSTKTLKGWIALCEAKNFFNVMERVARWCTKKNVPGLRQVRCSYSSRLTAHRAPPMLLPRAAVN